MTAGVFSDIRCKNKLWLPNAAQTALSLSGHSAIFDNHRQQVTGNEFIYGIQLRRLLLELMHLVGFFLSHILPSVTTRSPTSIDFAQKHQL